MNSSESPRADSSTIPRRLIRGAVIQLLHSSQKNSANPADPWPLILSQAESKIIRNRARTILHMQQKRARLGADLIANTAANRSLLESFLTEGQAASKSLKTLAESEMAIPDLLDLLRRHLKSSQDTTPIADALGNLRKQNDTSLTQLKALIPLLPAQDAPQTLAPLAAKLPPLQKSAALLNQLFSPNPSERPETEALRGALLEYQQFKDEASSLHQLVLQHLSATDQLIASQVKNFNPERLHQIDRAILRLAVTELHHCANIPSAVTIDEAIELARLFSDSDSSSFVNGVLDQLKPAS